MIKSKKTILGIVVIVVVAVFGFNTLMTPSVKKTVDSMPVTFEGYNGSGTMTLKNDKDGKKSAYKLLKTIALVDAKESGIDVSKVKKIIKNNPTDVSELRNQLTNTDSYSVSLNESPKYEKFIDHLEKIDISTGSSDLKNGDKVKLTVSDSSDTPYFKKVSKTYTVKGLKKVKTVTLSAKDFTVKTKGTNGYGSVSINYGKHIVASSTNENSGQKKQYVNGDSFTLTSKKVANALNKDSTKYKLSSNKISFKVSGFEDPIIAVSNLSDLANNDDTVVSAYISADTKKDITSGSPNLTVFTKNDMNSGAKYGITEYRYGVSVKNGKVDKGNTFPDYYSTDETPESYMSPTDEDSTPSLYTYKLVQK